MQTRLIDANSLDLEILKSNDMTSLGPGRTVHQSIVALFYDCTHLFNDSVRVVCHLLRL